MNRRLWIGFVVIFIVWSALSFIIHGVLLGGIYGSAEMAKVWRPDMESKMWVIYVVTAVTSFFLTLIYSKWQTGRGLVEGIQFGIYSGLLMATPMAYSSYAMYPIPYSLALQWFIYGMIHFFILGIVLALIFRKKAR